MNLLKLFTFYLILQSLDEIIILFFAVCKAVMTDVSFMFSNKNHLALLWTEFCDENLKIKNIFVI